MCPKRKFAGGEEGMRQRTLRRFRREEWSEERESVRIGEVSNLK